MFGEINNGKMILNDAGRVAWQCWMDIPLHFPQVILDEFVIMPNHIHGIIIINVGANNDSSQEVGANNDSSQEVGANNNSSQEVGANNDSSQEIGVNNNSPQQMANNDSKQRPRGTSKTVGSIVRGFKIGVTKWFRQNSDIKTVWQRNYYEHIIRNDYAMQRIREYIYNNPQKWQNNKYYVGANDNSSLKVRANDNSSLKVRANDNSSLKVRANNDSPQQERANNNSPQH